MEGIINQVKGWQLLEYQGVLASGFMSNLDKRVSLHWGEDLAQLSSGKNERQKTEAESVDNTSKFHVFFH
jgi:hypothetical protein